MCMHRCITSFDLFFLEGDGKKSKCSQLVIYIESIASHLYPFKFDL